MPTSQSSALATAGDEYRLSSAQKLFLAAFQNTNKVVPAARVALIHPSTVYVWKKHPGFVAEMQKATRQYYAAVYANAMSEVEAVYPESSDSLPTP